MKSDPFERLHPAVQHHIVNSLGWPSLRATQLAAISPILDNRHCILLAPTAGGKTEAAIFPLLSRMLGEDWRDLSVLYICPIRALLNNLEPQLGHYFSLVGRSVGVWHGDVSHSAKQRLLKSPPDLLLTTPESLEGMLISTDGRRRNLLMGVRLVVVDELHAFGGDDRGWHVRCLIRRLARLTARNIQIIGLTATVSNPAWLIDWLAYGAPAEVIGESRSGTEADVSLDYVGSLENAATVISRLHQGEKRLVFCDSRSKVEELSAMLRNLGVRTFVSHSSLSSDERRQAEKAFAEESVCVIVATSTLELGIDVGDLDRVIQIDAPSTVASFLQRMGRTGRRSNTLRNCLFLATEEEGFLVAAAIVRLWREAYVEAIIPPPQPLHIVAQQALALILHHSGIGRAELHAELGDLFPEIRPDLIRQIIGFMIEGEILWDDGGIVSMGVNGEEEFGRRHFEAVVSTFDAPLFMTVLYGQKELGTVDPMSLKPKGDGQPSILILAGRYWRVISHDWDSKIVRVEPSEDKGKAAWFGSSKSMGFDLCRMIHALLIDHSVPATLSKRAVAKLDELTDAFAFLQADKTVVVGEPPAEWRWWTFAGRNANWVLADICRHLGNNVVAFDNFSIKLKHPIESFPVDALSLASQMDADTEKKLMALADKLKYSVCLPSSARIRILATRVRNTEDALKISGIPMG
ncbi:MAG: DEAD/DEAH box helicase, partial [Candidatus Methylumidiphilus sp.]